MRDYSEKRGGRDIVQERKPVAKNRPRRESGGLVLLMWLVAFAGTFGVGFGAGWFVKGTRKQPAPVVLAPAVKKEEPTPAAEQPKAEVPLTFYKTLPAGGKGAMGTGLNLKKPEAPAAAREVPPAPANAPASAPAAPAAPSAEGAAADSSGVAAPVQAAKAQGASRFVVQLASYREKQEAVAAQSKLAEKGTAAYLVESRVPDRGTWYRLRVGRHLTRAEAGDLAAKYGKGAVVLPE